MDARHQPAECGLCGGPLGYEIEAADLAEAKREGHQGFCCTPCYWAYLEQPENADMWGHA